MSRTIKFEVIGGVGKITLNRPDKYNSINREMALEMQKRLDRCESSKEIRVILITGEGKAFCAGQDLAEAIDENNGIDITKIVEEHYNPIILKIRKIEKPVISAVNGVAAGAGANIALACDICVAAESAAFIQAFCKIGLIPDSAGTFFLPRLIGFQKATALMMTGDKVEANEAQQMGMIHKSFSDDSFEVELMRLATKMSIMPTFGLGMTKRLLNESMINNLEEQLAAEGEIQTACSKSYDYSEGVNAFLEKRKPVFKGE